MDEMKMHEPKPAKKPAAAKSEPKPAEKPVDAPAPEKAEPKSQRRYRLIVRHAPFSKANKSAVVQASSPEHAFEVYKRKVLASEDQKEVEAFKTWADGKTVEDVDCRPLD